MADNSINNKRIAKNTAFLYLRMSIVLVVTLYTTRVVLRSLGVEDYGIYNVVCGFVTMFSFLNATLSTSTNRFYNYELGKGNIEGVNDVYNISMRIQGGLAILILFVLESIGVWYLNNHMVIPIDKLATSNWIFQCALISMVFTILQTPYIAIILAYERMDYYAIVSIIDVILKLFIALAIPYIEFDKLFIYGFLIMLISMVDFFLYSSYFVINFPKLTLSKKINRPLFKTMLSFSGWSFFNPLAYTGRSQGCNIVLNFFFGPIVNAAYAVTNQVASAIDSFSMSVSVAARPQLIQSYSSGEYERVEKLFFSTSKMMFLLIAMLTIPLAFNMDYILKLWLGENVPEYTSIFCVWILMLKLVDSLNPPCTNLIMATGSIKIYMIVSSILIFSIVPISIIAFNIESNPILLFAIMLFFTLFNQITSVIILCNVFDVISGKKYFFEIVFPCAILFMALVSSIFAINQYIATDGFFMVVIDFIIAVVITILISYILLLNKTEKFFLINMVKKNKKVL